MVFTLTACEASNSGSSSSADSSTTTSDYTGKGDIDSFTIGTLGPTSGSTAVYGKATTNATKLAVDDYNKEHGTNIKVLVEDTAGDAAQAVNIYNKFTTQDGVAAIIGGTLSGETYAIAQKSSDTGIPILTPSGTAQNITDDTGDNVFRACYTDPQQAEKIADFAVDTLSAKKAAIIYNQDDDYSTGLEEAFTKEFESKGGTVEASEAFGSSDKDYSTQLTNIASKDIDVLFVPNYYEADVNIAKKARELGITAQLIGCDGWDGVVDVAGSDTSAIEGAIFINQYSPDMESVQNIMKEYQDAYGESINSFGINSYDSTILMIEAIREANSLKASDIVAQLKKTDYDGVLGNIKFDDNGDPIKTPIFVTIKDGAYVTYKTK